VFLALALRDDVVTPARIPPDQPFGFEGGHGVLGGVVSDAVLLHEGADTGDLAVAAFGGELACLNAGAQFCGNAQVDARVALITSHVTDGSSPPSWSFTGRAGCSRVVLYLTVS
jgi:hypothetical protein